MMEQSIRRGDRRYGASGQVPQKEAVGEEDVFYMGKIESIMVERGESAGRGSGRYGST